MKLSIWTWKYLFPLQEKKKKKAHEKKEPTTTLKFLKDCIYISSNDFLQARDDI